jgi:hypothetical protein
MAGITSQNIRDFLFFADASGAMRSGFHSKRNGSKKTHMAAG